jgi:Tfp pilus assembly protein PilW
MKLKSRKGLSMAELIVGMVILAVVGMALTRVMVMQARYFDHQKQDNLARNVSRGPLNRLVSDIRMVEAEGGISAASATAVTARVRTQSGSCVTAMPPAPISVFFPSIQLCMPSLDIRAMHGETVRQSIAM